MTIVGYILIVAVGIVLMVNAYYENSYDVREVEAQILSDKVADCIYFGGEVNPLLFTTQGVFREDFRDFFMQRCSLNFSVKGEFSRIPYYIEVRFFPLESEKEVFNITHGNKNFKPDCGIDVAGDEKLAKCSEKDFYMRADSGNVYLVKVLSIVAKTNENTQ